MITATSAETTIIHEEFWWGQRFPEGDSGSVASVRNFTPQIKVVGQGGKKNLWYGPDSFWAAPPVDLGEIRSDQLDDFLYGTEG